MSSESQGREEGLQRLYVPSLTILSMARQSKEGAERLGGATFFAVTPEQEEDTHQTKGPAGALPRAQTTYLLPPPGSSHRVPPRCQVPDFRNVP